MTCDDLETAIAALCTAVALTHRFIGPGPRRMARTSEGAVGTESRAAFAPSYRPCFRHPTGSHSFPRLALALLGVASSSPLPSRISLCDLTPLARVVGRSRRPRTSSRHLKREAGLRKWPSGRPGDHSVIARRRWRPGLFHAIDAEDLSPSLPVASNARSRRSDGTPQPRLSPSRTYLEASVGGQPS